MPVEVEARFRASGSGPLDLLASVQRLGRAALGVASTADEVDRYLDTADGQLAAAGWACRLRERAGSTRISLKGPAVEKATGWLHRRPELEGPATSSTDPSDWPGSEARALLATLSGGAPLRERLSLAQRRTERAVMLADGRRLGTLTLDRVRILAGGRDGGELHVVELELGAEAADEAELADPAHALASTPGLEAEPRTKLDIALELLRSPRAAGAE